MNRAMTDEARRPRSSPRRPDHNSSVPSLRVRQAEVHPLTAPLVTAFRIATGQHDHLENVLLKIELEDGTAGYGEAGVATHITGETLEQTTANLQTVARDLVGANLAEYRACCERFRPAFHQNAAAQAAFEMAVLDAVARSCGFPFWRFFGNRPARCVTDITIVIGSVEEAESQTRHYYRLGFRTFKIKIGTDEDLDIARVRAVATHAPDAALLLDGNQGYDAPRMLALLRTLRRHGVQPNLLEQPVPREDWDGLARLTRESGVLVCADESVRTLADAAYAIKTGAVKAINVKFAKSGVLQAADIARLARGAGLKLMVGAMLESAVSITAAAQFAAGMGCFDFIDLDTTYFIGGPLAVSPCLDGFGRFNFRSPLRGIGVVVGIGGPKTERGPETGPRRKS